MNKKIKGKLVFYYPWGDDAYVLYDPQTYTLTDMREDISWKLGRPEIDEDDIKMLVSAFAKAVEILTPHM